MYKKIVPFCVLTMSLQLYCTGVTYRVVPFAPTAVRAFHAAAASSAKRINQQEIFKRIEFQTNIVWCVYAAIGKWLLELPVMVDERTKNKKFYFYQDTSLLLEIACKEADAIGSRKEQRMYAERGRDFVFCTAQDEGKGNELEAVLVKYMEILNTALDKGHTQEEYVKLYICALAQEMVAVLRLDN